MRSEALDRLAAKLERYPVHRRQPPLGPYLDAVCESLIESGIERARVEYIDVGQERVRHGNPKYEPARVAVPPGLSDLIHAVADRCAPPIRRRHVSWSNDELVVIDPRQKPRAQHFCRGVFARVIEVTASDDPELRELIVALETCFATEVEVGFDQKSDGRASAERIEPTPATVVLTPGLSERLAAWVTQTIECQPLDLPICWAGGFVKFDVAKRIATTHHRTARMVATDGSIV